MKKLLAVILSVAMLFSVMCVSAFAAESGKDDAEIDSDLIFGSVSVSFDKATVKAGEEVTVDLMLKENNFDLTEIKVTFTLPEGVTIVKVENGDLGTAALSNNVVTVASEAVIAESGCIAKVTFKATADGEKAIGIAVNAKAGAEDVLVNGEASAITVTKADDLLIGDVDDDGLSNTTDLALMKLFLAGVGEINEAAADIDGNGDVDTTDLAMLKLKLAGVNQ